MHDEAWVTFHNAVDMSAVKSFGLSPGSEERKVAGMLWSKGQKLPVDSIEMDKSTPRKRAASTTNASAQREPRKRSEAVAPKSGAGASKRPKSLFHSKPKDSPCSSPSPPDGASQQDRAPCVPPASSPMPMRSP